MANYEIKDFPSYQAKQEAHADERKTWTWDEYHKKDGKLLAKMKTEDPKRFSALFAAKYGKAPLL